MDTLLRRSLILLAACSLLLLPSAHAQQPGRAEAELEASKQRAQSLEKQGKLDEAIAEYSNAVTLSGRVHGPSHLDTVPLQEHLANLYFLREKYDKAEYLYKRAVDIRRSRLPADHSDLAQALDALGDFYKRRGQFADARPLYLESLKIYRVRKEPLHEVHSLVRLAALDAGLGDYRAAVPLLQRALDLLANNPAAAASDRAGLLNNLAAAYKLLGRYALAEPRLEESLRLRKQQFGDSHPLVAQSLNNLGELYHLTGRYDQADTCYREALKIQDAKLDAGHADRAQTLGNLGLLQLARGNFTAAEPLLERSLKILEARLGPEHSGVAQGLNNLALLRKATGQYERAEALYERSLQIRKDRLGPEHPEVAQSLGNLANLYVVREQYRKAEPLYLEALKIQEARLGKDHPAVAQTASNLAGLYVNLERYDEAERLLRRSLQIRRDRLGEDHPEVGLVLKDLALLYRVRGQYDRAEPLFRASIKVFEAALDPTNPNLAQAQLNLALLYAARGRWAQAADSADRARHAVRGHVHRVLPGLSEPEQLLFLRTQYQTSFDTALSLALARTQDPALAELSAGWVLNGKAVAQQALAERVLLARDAGNSALAGEVKQLLDVRTQLATLSLQGPAAGQETAHRQELARLAAREEALAKRLGRLGGNRAGGDPWADLDAVRAALPADAVLVEIVRLRLRDVTAPGVAPVWQAAHYAAWVIPAAGKGKVELIDLGAAERIEAAVAAVQKELQDAPRAISDDEQAAERRLRRELEPLAELVLRPVAARAGGARRLLLSPDGALWLVPWAALPSDDQGTYAVEKYAIGYVVSGRDLLVPPAKERPGPALVLADPDYDRQPAGGSTAVRGGAEGLARIGRAKRLPGTAAEARAIAPRLKAYTGEQPRVFLAGEAREGVFKSARGPRVVVLSTHGFFLDEPADGRGSKVLQNPLLRCGLLLAGCNHRDRLPPGEEDGVLTGLEIAGADLRGTELVVLSACETGLGDVHNGEGVAGLRQAFQLAGARSVVATLWQIPDRETVPLMTAFFDGLAKGESKSDALRDAQLRLLKQRREGKQSGHPFFWAAFTLTGE
jgi:CHAT domain-containing protein/Flp pilus assembly protein TadD